MKVPFWLMWGGFTAWGLVRLVDATSWNFFWGQLGLAFAASIASEIAKRCKL